MTEPPIRVLIVDDHPVYRDGLRMVVASADTTVVVGEAAHADEAVALAEELAPDVVILDLHLPDRSGLEALREMRALPRPPAVVVLSMLEDDDAVFAAMQAGASGYLVKGAARHDIVAAIATVASGGAVFGADIAQRLLGAVAGTRPARPFAELTDREYEILELVASGMRNPAIARALHLSPKTVMNNVSSILAKLQAADRAEAIIRARDAGLGRSSGVR